LILNAEGGEVSLNSPDFFHEKIGAFRLSGKSSENGGKLL
jgi:hypothetical protein